MPHKEAYQGPQKVWFSLLQPMAHSPLHQTCQTHSPCIWYQLCRPENKWFSRYPFYMLCRRIFKFHMREKHTSAPLAPPCYHEDQPEVLPGRCLPLQGGNGLCSPWRHQERDPRWHGSWSWKAQKSEGSLDLCKVTLWRKERWTLTKWLNIQK